MTTLAKYTYLGLGTVVQVDYTEPNVRYDLVTGGSSTNPYGGLDRFGRVTDLVWQKYSGTPTDLVRLEYGYDRVSNRTYRENQVAPSGFDELYAYDGIHRLKDFDRGDLNANKDAITSPTLEQSWGLDTTGNWSTFEQNVPGTSSQDLTQSRTHNKVNEITGISETVGASWVTPQHDRNGNMTFMPQPAEPTKGFTATYDAWNRLVKLEEDVEPGSSSSSSSSSESSSSSSTSSESGSSSSSSSESQSSSSSSSQEPLVVTYAYDGKNWRTEKDVNGETTHFYYSHRWQCLEERESTSTDAHIQYVWGLRYIDDLVLRDRDTTGNGTLDERLYGLQDDNWNVVGICNAAAAMQERYSYAAYGTTSFLTPSFTDRQSSVVDWKTAFTGRQRDPETALYCYRNRYLHTQLGRFLRPDPLRFSAGSLNFFSYVRGRPLLSVDPYGLASPFEEVQRLGPVESFGERVFPLLQPVHPVPADFAENLDALLSERTEGLSPATKRNVAFTLRFMYTKGGLLRALATEAVDPDTHLKLQLSGISLPVGIAAGGGEPARLQLLPGAAFGASALATGITIPSRTDDPTNINFPPLANELPTSRAFADATVMAHELGHALVKLTDPMSPAAIPAEIRVAITVDAAGAAGGELLSGFGTPCGGNVTLIENQVRKELGIPIRRTYLGSPVPSLINVGNSEKAKYNNFALRHGLPQVEPGSTCAE